MNPYLFTIGGIAGIGIAKRFIQNGSVNAYTEKDITLVANKISQVAVIKNMKSPEENVSFIEKYLISLKGKKYFQEMIQNLMVCSISESNKIYYFEMDKNTFKKVINNYLKSIQMWFSSDFLDFSPKKLNIKKSWFAKGSKSIKKMENLFYENKSFYIYCVFKKLPFISTNTVFVEQATLTAKLFLNTYKEYFEKQNFFYTSEVSRFDTTMNFVPLIDSPDAGYDAVNFLSKNYPKTSNLLDTALASRLPSLIASDFSLFKTHWDQVLMKDFSEIPLPIWMPPYELHYLFMISNIENIFFRTKIYPVKLWEA